MATSSQQQPPIMDGEFSKFSKFSDRKSIILTSSDKWMKQKSWYYWQENNNNRYRNLISLMLFMGLNIFIIIV